MSAKRLLASLLALVGLAALVGTTGDSLASFTAIVSNSDNTFRTAGRFAPDNLAVKSISGSQIQLRWTVDSGLSWAVGYNVYRRSAGSYPSAPLNPSPIAPCSPVSCATIFDTTLPDSATYYFVVRGVDDQGREGPASNEVSVHADLTPPYVTAANPYDGTVGVSTSPTIQVFFNKPMNPGATAPAISLVACGDNSPTCASPETAIPIAVTWNHNNTIASFGATGLSNGRWHRIRVTSAAQSAANVALAAQFNSAFQTIASGTPPPSLPQVVPPTSPDNQAAGVPINTSIIINFNQTMDQPVTQSAVSLKSCGNVPATPSRPATTCEALGGSRVPRSR